MKHIVLIARILLGLVFVFSGFVKGIDPVGLSYKFTDYFQALNFHSLESMSMSFAYLLPAAEFFVGVGLIFGIGKNIFGWGGFLFMLFFTPLSLYIAIKDPVTDCGCFGDAFIITNWQTFYKNIFFLGLSVVLILYGARYSKSWGKWWSYSFVILALVGYGYAVQWSEKHEPLIDFRPYKVGANLWEGMQVPEGAEKAQYTNVYYYRNLKTDEVKKFGDNDYPWQDSINWKFEKMDKPKLIKQGYVPAIKDFSIVSFEKQDLTELFLRDTSFTFMVITPDLSKADLTKQQQLNQLATWARAQGHNFIGLTATTGEQLDDYCATYQPTYNVMHTDQIVLKTMMRSNPGLMLIQNGTVVAKWAFADIPSVDGADVAVKRHNISGYLHYNAPASQDSVVLFRDELTDEEDQPVKQPVKKSQKDSSAVSSQVPADSLTKSPAVIPAEVTPVPAHNDTVTTRP